MKNIFLFMIGAILLASCSSKNDSANTETAITDKEVTTKTSAKKVLFVLTSHSELGETGEKTGFWIEEFASPYYLLKDKGIEITIASPKGGQPPIDPKSQLADYQTESTKRYNEDKDLQALLANTQKLDNINAADYDAVFYPGGHGPLWDLAENQKSITLIESFYAQNKPIGAVCHAPAIFKNTKNTDGTALVSNQKVTGFSNTEEAAVALTDVVPFLLEDMLKANGGIYSKGNDWEPYAVENTLIITGQNPASSELVAEKLFNKLK